VKLQFIDAKLLQAMFISGAQLLEEKKQAINELNVFPVPDGDTGTNMSLTMLASAKEVESSDPQSVSVVAKAAASGALRGARGNSGVILSQLIRGFSKGLSEESVADTVILANAFQKGVDTAYKAVMKPKEGTILTVAREIASKALEVCIETEDIEEFLNVVLRHGYDVLNKTPEMLPVLKQAGVVDAGGQGLLTILEGAARVVIEDLKIEIKKTTPKMQSLAFEALKTFDTESITFGYCTEFIVNRNPYASYKEDNVKNYLDSIGDSIVVVSDEEYIKVHVHTDNPGLALQEGLKYGSLSNIKIENMREQHSSIFNSQEQTNEEQISNEPKKHLGFVSVSAGKGITEIIKSLGVDEIIEGGQTMNPSTEDISIAIKKCNAENVIVLPNNKNIILAAEQAAIIEEECKVFVLPSKTIPQGISAMISYDGRDEEPEAIVENMKEAMAQVETAQITIAVRDTIVDDLDIKEGEYLGILDGKIVVHDADLKNAGIELLKKMKQDAEVLTIYYGEEVDETTATELQEEAEAMFADADVELYEGNQPVFHFIISAE
jgi:DAK2 domain fusion protein YloV